MKEMAANANYTCKRVPISGRNNKTLNQDNGRPGKKCGNNTSGISIVLAYL